MSVRFADCRLDSDARQLFRAGRAVRLSPKAFELLRVLVEQRPRALSKSELLERIWPDVFVSDASLARVVNELRRSLGDVARPGRVIRTVHKFGYAFAADVQGEAPETRPRPKADGPACWLVGHGREFLLVDGEHLIGREPDVTVRLDSPKVSRHHARVVVQSAEATIEDLGSKNGTFVHGSRIAARVPLENGDAVRVGEFRLTFKVAVRLPSTETEVGSQP